MEELDLPLITESTNEFYRTVYADVELGAIFKGRDMLVLRKHTAYFIHQLAAFECPMMPHQIAQLNRYHGPVIAKYKTTQRHFDRMMQHLSEALLAHGAQLGHLVFMKAKLQPLRDMFPPDTGRTASDGMTGTVDVVATVPDDEKQEKQQAHKLRKHKQQQQQQQQEQEELRTSKLGSDLQQQEEQQEQDGAVAEMQPGGALSIGAHDAADGRLSAQGKPPANSITYYVEQTCAPRQQMADRSVHKGAEAETPAISNLQPARTGWCCFCSS